VGECQAARWHMRARVRSAARSGLQRKSCWSRRFVAGSETVDDFGEQTGAVAEDNIRGRRAVINHAAGGPVGARGRSAPGAAPRASVRSR
jgi:hypothetical protein